jgi:hypothetical protein
MLVLYLKKRKGNIISDERHEISVDPSLTVEHLKEVV